MTVASLKARMEELYTARREKNSFASGRECERLSSVCEQELVGLQVMRLPRFVVSQICDTPDMTS